MGSFSWPAGILSVEILGGFALGLLLPSDALFAKRPSISLPANGPLLIATLPSSNTSVSAPAFQSDPTFLDTVIDNAEASETVCNGTMFGSHLNKESCYDAIQLLTDDTTFMSFGDRGQGCNVQLPRRFSSLDGTCVVDIFHRDGAVSDIADSRQIRFAALAVFTKCVEEDHMWSGGYTRDVGNFKNLVVLISVFKPIVTCFGSIEPLRETKQALIDAIPTSFGAQTFGPPGKGEVDVVLPKTFSIAPVHPPYDIYAKIDVNERQIVQGRWFELWTNAVAIDAICVRGRGMAGVSYSKHGLSIALMLEFSSMATNRTDSSSAARAIEGAWSA